MVSSLKAISSIREKNFHINIASLCSGDIHSLDILLWWSRHCPRSWIDIDRRHVYGLKELAVQGRKWTFDQWLQWRMIEVSSGCCRRTGLGKWRLGRGRRWVMKYHRKGEGISWLGFRAGPCTSLSTFIPHFPGPSSFLNFSLGHPNLTVSIFLHDPCPQNQVPHFFLSKWITDTKTTLKKSLIDLWLNHPLMSPRYVHFKKHIVYFWLFVLI